jgi:type VI secretion system protein
MASEHSLFERLADPALAERRSLRPDAGAVAASIMANLHDLLNTRHGASAMLPDYGMPDFNDLVLQFPDAIEVIGQELRACITTYEKRLTSVRVVHVPDPANPLSLCYQISAETALAGQRIAFETQLGNDGSVRLR